MAKKTAGKGRGGRPSSFKPEYCEQARKLCMLLGATDAQLADFFEVTETTVNNWKKAHPEFFESLKKGKAQADGDVVESLYRRALGYSHEAVKIVADAKTGSEHVVPYTEHYPPDTTACIFWLKNRQPAAWRDKTDIEHSGKAGVLVVPAPLSTDDWSEAAREQQRAISEKRE